MIREVSRRDPEETARMLMNRQDVTAFDVGNILLVESGNPLKATRVYRSTKWVTNVTSYYPLFRMKMEYGERIENQYMSSLNHLNSINATKKVDGKDVIFRVSLSGQITESTISTGMEILAGQQNSFIPEMMG